MDPLKFKKSFSEMIEEYEQFQRDYSDITPEMFETFLEEGEKLTELRELKDFLVEKYPSAFEEWEERIA